MLHASSRIHEDDINLLDGRLPDRLERYISCIVTVPTIEDGYAEALSVFLDLLNGTSPEVITCCDHHTEILVLEEIGHLS
jgi:hypothetical protein